MQLSKELTFLLNQEADWRNNTINLNASENYTSPMIKKLIGLHPSYDFYDFPPSGGVIVGPWSFSNTIYLQNITNHINQLSESLLSCPTLDTRAKGGQAAEIAVLTGLGDSNDHVFYVQEKDGGHFGLNFICKKIGIVLTPIYFDKQKYQIDVDNTIKIMRKVWKNKTSKKLIILSQSFILCQQPLKYFVERVKNSFSDTVITYDISHILGLIVGKQLINPITQGVDIIHGSTHKTFPGPQKGIIGFPISCNENIKENIKHALSPGLQSNCGTSEVLALAATLEEMKLYGKDYAQTTCLHAKYLANLLDSSGLSVAGKQFGFTETHQIWVTIGTEQQAWQACARLHNAGIRVYPANLPFINTWGLRLGTNAMTRLGFSTNEIKKVGQWMVDILLNDVEPKKVLENVQSLMQEFSIKGVHFTFKN